MTLTIHTAYGTPQQQSSTLKGLSQTTINYVISAWSSHAQPIVCGLPAFPLRFEVSPE